MKRFGPALTVMCLALLCAACTEEQLPALELPIHCNPLAGASCILPWPSSYYLESSPDMPTGRRINYPPEALPSTLEGAGLDPTRYNRLDGFSVGSQILVAFAEGVSAAGLPAPEDLARSITDESPILLIDMERGDRVPLFAEVDANVETDPAGAPLEEPALIIRPMEPLRFSSRYIVAIREGLEDRKGAPLAPPEPFRRLRDGDPIGSPALQMIQPAIEEVLAFLAGQGIPRSELVLAWDFHTASQEATRGRLRGMVTEALARLPEGGPAVHDLKVTDHTAEEEPHLLRTITGQLEVPTFLESDQLDSWMQLDAAGAPVLRGDQRFPFLITIPRCAAQRGGLPVVIFGHGLFRYQHSLSEEHQKMIADRLCVVTAAVDWIGLSLNDLVSILKFVVQDFSTLPRITDQLQQAHVNMHALTRLLGGAFTASPAMQVNGEAVTDGQEMYYWGISNGGIQGVTFAALNDKIQRFLLNVPGANWSLMLQRSSNFTLLNLPLSQSYPSATDRLILISLSQHLWDHTDPIAFAEGLLTDSPDKRVLLQEALDDVEVSNLSTRVLARGLKIPALAPVVKEVYGLSPIAGPLDSAYVQWETHQPQQPPGTNVPAPSLAAAESSHKIVRTLESCIKQMEQFFKPAGRVVHSCEGPCDPD